MPKTPITTHGLAIFGGHNVVMIGGQISLPYTDKAGSRYGMWLRGQTGTVHIEGVRIDGPGLTDGIDLDQRLGATVQIENVRIGPIRAHDEQGFSDTHPDILQSWGGPASLRVDHLTGMTDYQGFFLHPTEYDKSATIKLADLRNVNIATTNPTHQVMWQMTRFPVALTNVWVKRPANGASTMSYPSSGAWDGVRPGDPGSGDFVPEGVAGIGYQPVGYSAG